jgi:peptide/nickel transport system substrate-binding protein
MQKKRKMNRRIVVEVLGCLAILTLVLSWTATTAVGQTKKKEEPKRGGTLTLVSELAPTGGFDPIYSLPYGHLGPVTIPLMSGDFYAGPAGQNKVTWRYAEQEQPQFMNKGLAERWTIPNPSTIIFHLRKGIKWHDKPPVNGREVTAEDMKWSYERLTSTPTSGLSQIEKEQAGGKITYTAVDKYTFKIEFAKADMRSMFTARDWYRHTAKEVIEKYGNQNDWKNVVGNGPFLLTDYAEGSSLTYKSNPNYWETDPEGRKLPYIDGFQILIIGDRSTRLAALRAGKIDILSEVEWRDADDVLKTNPNIKSTGEYTFSQPYVGFNCSMKPFDDLKVRRALYMAIDEGAIVKGYHKGHSSIVVTGMQPPGFSMVPTMGELPATTKELFQYNPEKAKQLLTEAGYPNGFKTTMSILSRDEPYASLVKAYWSQVGVDASIDVLEVANYTSQLYGFKFASWLGRWGFSWGNWSWVFQPGANWNYTRITDPTLSKLIAEATMNYVDWNKWVKDWKAINIRVLDQAYEHLIPGPNVRTLWQPWLKNYSGELYLGRTGYYLYPAYIWADKGK